MDKYIELYCMLEFYVTIGGLILAFLILFVAFVLQKIENHRKL